MMVWSDKYKEADFLGWSNAFREECSTLCLTCGDTALTTNDYDMAIELYSVAIGLDSATDVIFENCSKAKLGKMLWMDVLLDAQKVIQLNHLSHMGYNTETQKLCQQYLSPSEADCVIQQVIDAQLDNPSLHVLDTITGLLCKREAQICTFKLSIEYMELLSSTITYQDIQVKHIKEVVKKYFQYAMLSHRLDPVGSIKKLQSFCKTARDLGYHWAWSDTCCIDKINNVKLQESVNSMFVWYHHSALMVIYLLDVPPSSKPDALARSTWNTCGWTVQEFLTPNVIIFYQKDWTPHLGDHTPNHKVSQPNNKLTLGRD
ncbi:uncharacterized protein HD556DRAFT_1314224 [Suillus plorans]|uniref:Heterokaryon incompatibility domain-containing protein n=1 Tax=Suillus plorans TaxID=116603 RepID=A0A9P7AAW0_9AGAM|nr:uncharacterized protein HD556DRAFT_1314224 [Suillus plorans]KAG1785526.1 hypothetical protein HD556DRAFT_1314224 [Suillus plorans]